MVAPTLAVTLVTARPIEKHTLVRTRAWARVRRPVYRLLIAVTSPDPS